MRRIVLIVLTAVLLGAAAVAFAVTRGPSPTTATAGPTPTAGVPPTAATTPAADAAASPNDAGIAPAPVTASRAAGASTRAPGVRLKRVPGAYDQPLYVAAPPGDTSRVFIVEKTGAIRIVKGGTPLDRPFLDISDEVSRGGEQGLLSMAFHPGYAGNGYFYVNYTDRSGDTRVVRYRVSRTDPDRAAASTARRILFVRQPYANHNGGQLQFGPDGRLYVGMGDGGSGGDPQDRAQSPRTRLGKLLRLNVDVWPVRVTTFARGLRNPWRFSFDRRTGALWIGDVGQSAREEIDYLRPGSGPGANFGWSGYEGTRVYDQARAARLDKGSLTFPVSQYGRALGYSVTGGYVYRGAAIPSLRGFYLFGDFGSGHVWAKRGPGGARRILRGADREVGQISSFGEDAAGEVYITSLTGRVYRIAP